MELLYRSNPTALWYDIVHEAQIACAVTLAEEIEAYLVFLLMRYTARPEIIQHIIALKLLEGMQLKKHERAVILQEVGDKCLLFSGLFPALAEKRLTRLGYFIRIGQAAYGNMSEKRNDMYSVLSKQFVTLMDVLQSIRCYTKHYPDLLPLDAYDLWFDTGSQRALSILKHYTQKSFIILNSPKK